MTIQEIEMQKQAKAYQAKIKDLDMSILRLEELLTSLDTKEAVNEEILEQVYGDYLKAVGARTVLEGKLNILNDSLLNKEIEKTPEPTEIADILYEACTCNIYAWLDHTCPYAEASRDSVTRCVCCPYCEQCCEDDS